MKGRIDEIEKIVLTTHDSAIRIISKEGALANPADRDHCLQYMVAVPLLTGDLMAENYEDDYHEEHLSIDELREKMVVEEDAQYSKDYPAVAAAGAHVVRAAERELELHAARQRPRIRQRSVRRHPGGRVRHAGLHGGHARA